MTTEATPVTAAAPVVTPETAAAAPVVTPETAAAAPAATPEASASGTPAAEAGEVDYTDFTFPDGFDAAQMNIDEVKAAAKELGLDQAGAQKLVDRVIKQRNDFQTNQQTEHDKQIARWADEAKADPEIGGDKFDASLAAARSVIENPKLVAPGFKAFLDASGLGNHPEMIRTLSKIAPAFGNDTPVPPGRPASQGDALSKLYDNPTSQPAKG